MFHSGIYLKRGDKCFSKITRHKKLVNGFNGTASKGIITSSIDAQMAAWSFSLDADLREECPKTKMESLTSFVQLKSKTKAKTHQDTDTQIK